MSESKVLIDPSEYDILAESKDRERTSKVKPARIEDPERVPSIYIEIDQKVSINDLIMTVGTLEINLEYLTCGQLVNKLNGLGINAYLTNARMWLIPSVLILNYSNNGTSRTEFFSGRIPKAALSIKYPENVVLSSDKSFKILSVYASNNLTLTPSDKKVDISEDGQYFFLKEDYTNVSIAYSYFVSKFILFTCEEKIITTLPEDKKGLSLAISKKIISKTVDSTYADNKL